MDLLNTLKNCRQYDLCQPIVKGMPIHPAHPPYHITLNNRHGDVIRECGHQFFKRNDCHQYTCGYPYQFPLPRFGAWETD